ncbi:MAG: glycosyltransferase family 9 protein [Calditrichia bacterium]
MPEYFAELGKRLLATFPDLQIVIIGAKADVARNELQKSIEISDRVVSTAGKFTIRETTELLSHARVLVGNDSGPMHLGVVAGVPTVGFVRTRNAGFYAVRGVTITSRFPLGEMCSPCISVYNEKVVDCCRGVVCMKNISVETVFRAVVERLTAYIEYNIP